MLADVDFVTATIDYAASVLTASYRGVILKTASGGKKRARRSVMLTELGTENALFAVDSVCALRGWVAGRFMLGSDEQPGYTACTTNGGRT